ncbi:DUF4297 family anti-phage-associated protein [Butyrivibrio sp. INlla16]|uniref:DUF4297 family anti-phage-associated protein n=1 Tax=Butyrivibrio sp. INlla16 TaxID=1520807 RepID=UPI000886D11A|nr:DUF4297 family anti-phage-associated protein [Butyrivibrio sp. INlla16]SDB04801.1 hypothetical protein SAMN02910263_00203 [Butyrivibrio sp. INlla16]
MPRSREATSTIKGYYYQFDYYILQLLYLQNNNASVCVEGIEDVDIILDEFTEAVQCKYYEETKCVPSKVGEAIRPMLRHYASNKDERMYRYRLYGHYNSGMDTIPKDIDVAYAKEKFFTYKNKGKEHILYEELNLDDLDIKKFLDKLELQLEADSYEEQIEKIVAKLQSVIGCTEYDARFFYYNNAVTFVKNVAVKKTKPARTVTKGQFIAAIKRKQELFDRWYIDYIGFDKYYKAVRKQFFTVSNISPTHRFFLVEYDGTSSDLDMAEIIMETSKKWSRTSKREPYPFCPYIYLHGLSDTRLANVKKLLTENAYYIWDGYEYKDATFNPSALSRPINAFLGVRAKILCRKYEIDLVLDECKGTKEVYQFFLQKPFYERKQYVGRDFQILRTKDVTKII